MANPRYYPQQPPPLPPSHRDQMLAQFNQPEQGGMDPGALMQMLGHLYGIQQGQQEMGLKQQELGVKQKALGSEDAYHQAQVEALHRHLPENLRDLTPEAQNYIVGEAYPGFGRQQAEAAAAKAAQRQALIEQDKAAQAGGTVAQGQSRGLGAGIHDTVVNFPQHLQDADTNMGNYGTNFWSGLLGYKPDESQLGAAHQFMQQAAKMPNQPTHDPLGDWISSLFGGMTGPKQPATPSSYTPPANTFAH